MNVSSQRFVVMAAIGCPDCGAVVGEMCRGVWRPRLNEYRHREKLHESRVKAFAAGNQAGVRIPSPDEVMAAQTENGGWLKKDLASWGIPWPPPKGWKQRLEREWRARNA